VGGWWGDTVSSWAGGEGLAGGEMKGVRECMGRPYRLIGRVDGWEGGGGRIAPGAFLNQFPAAGGYDVRVGTRRYGKVGNQAIGVGLDVDVALRPGRVVVDEDGGATVRVEEGEQEAEEAEEAEEQQLCVLEFDEGR